MGIAQGSQTLEEFRSLHQEAVVGGKRFNHHGCNLISMLLEEVFNGF